MLSGFKVFHHRQKAHHAEKIIVKGEFGFLIQIEREELDAVLCRGLLRHRQLIHREFFLKRGVGKKIRERAAANVKDAARAKVGRNKAVGALCPQVGEDRFEHAFPACKFCIGHP